MDETTSRPLDALNQARGKRVIIQLKTVNKKTIKKEDGTSEIIDQRVEFVGKLNAFDIHINTVLEEAEEMIGGIVTRKLGKLFIRGDTIITISPTTI
jgi:small nuclear ribonucleoprotein